MDVAGEQGGADLPLEVIDSPADAVDGELEALSRGPETSAAHHFQKNPGGVPIRQPAESCPMAFFLGNAPFQRQMHTSPLPLDKLGRISSDPQP
jgi:hypothetical protein